MTKVGCPTMPRMAPPPHAARISTLFPRGCQARRHDVEDNITSGCQAPPPRVGRIRALFPRGATFNIVGPKHAAYVDDRVPNNIENGTSAARGPYQQALPERSGLSRRSRKRSRTPPPQVACLWRRRPACACSRDGRTTNLRRGLSLVEIPILSAALPVSAPLGDVCDRKGPLVSPKSDRKIPKDGTSGGGGTLISTWLSSRRRNAVMEIPNS